MSVERRAATRYPVTWPVELDGGTGVTRNLSANGVAIETDRVLSEGDSVRFTVRMPEATEGLSRLLCEGPVVRVEPQGRQWAVAVRFAAVRFEQ